MYREGSGRGVEFRMLRIIIILGLEGELSVLAVVVVPRAGSRGLGGTPPLPLARGERGLRVGADLPHRTQHPEGGGVRAVVGAGARKLYQVEEIMGN